MIQQRMIHRKREGFEVRESTADTQPPDEGVAGDRRGEPSALQRYIKERETGVWLLTQLE